MGKKRVITKVEEGSGVKPSAAEGPRASGESRSDGPGVNTTHRVSRGIAHIQATYNNTIVMITDVQGNTIAWSSAGALGFSGTKKSTPFAAARVAEAVAEKVKRVGLSEVMVRVSGVGSGRDSAIRALANHGLNLTSIKDVTPLPHNGPRPKKVRRV